MTASLWYLGALTISLILMMFLERFCINDLRKVITVCSLVVLSYFSSKIDIIIPFRLKVIFTTTLFIFIGYYLKQYITIIKQISWKWMIIILLVFLLLAISNKTVNLSIPVYNDYAIYLITALFGVLITFWVSCLSFSHNRVLSFLGRNSLIIFCTHKIWIVVFVRLLNSFTGLHYVYMNNIPNHYCIIGCFFVLLLSVPTVLLIRPIYNHIYSFLMDRINIQQT